MIQSMQDVVSQNYRFFFFEVFGVFSVSYFLIIVRGERKGIRYSLANMPGL